MRFCIRLYDEQLTAGRYFTHEHPDEASSWQMPEILQLMMKEGVECETIDMCQYGMKAEEAGVVGPARKRTKMISNSKEALKRVATKCPNSGGPGDAHEHVQLNNGLAKNGQVDPRKLCQATCEGIVSQKRIDELGLKADPLMSVEETTQRFGKGPSN